MPAGRGDYDIRCPQCGARAVWDEAFERVPTRAGKPLPSDDPRPVHQWGGWWLRERYPSILPWRPPKARGDQVFWPGEFGVVQCPSCHLVAPHPLNWPADAFFQWRIRGTVLWAWNAKHARVLLDYIGSQLRDPWRYEGGYGRYLQKLPAPVLAARNRERVTRRIAESLREAAISPEPPLRGTT
jgi:hypothetical protein